MLAAVALVVVIALSLMVIRIGSVALTLTGLSQDVAGFQALDELQPVWINDRTVSQEGHSWLLSIRSEPF